MMLKTEERERGWRGLWPRAVVNGGHGAVAEETPKWTLPRAKTVTRAIVEARAARGEAVGACWRAKVDYRQCISPAGLWLAVASSSGRTGATRKGKEEARRSEGAREGRSGRPGGLRRGHGCGARRWERGGEAE
jgi:hypothetical protein